MHCAACIWIHIGITGEEGGWIAQKGILEESEIIIYFTSLEFITQTATSVGYGEI